MDKEQMIKMGVNPEEILQQSQLPQDLQPQQGQMPVQNNIAQNLMQQTSSNTEYQQNGIPNQINNVNPQQPVQGQLSVNMIKQVAARDVQNIQNLVRSGSISQVQGRNLMDYVTKKAFDMVSRNQKNGLAEESVPQSIQERRNSETVLDNSEFFNLDGRSDVLDYLKKTNTTVGKDEISQISSMIEKLENTAIDRYLRSQKHEQTLNDENEVAKLRLRANAQNSINADSKNVVFTREQIGKMSGAEFSKNERVIMDQLKKGLIR